MRKYLHSAAHIAARTTRQLKRQRRSRSRN